MPAPEIVVGTVTPDPTALILSLTPTSAAEITNVPETEVTKVKETVSIGELPEEHFIYNINGHKQFFPLGCETSAAIDWAAYFGFEINEFEFQTLLPLSDNPDFGFVGSVESPWGQAPPYGYGVHAYPVADLLNEYGLNAVGVKNFTGRRNKRADRTGPPCNCLGNW